MSIDEDLRTYLLADGTLAGLIGARLHPDTLPQDPTMPAITYSTISGERPLNADGPTDLSRPRFQFDCFGSTSAQAMAVFEALKNRLNGARNDNASPAGKILLAAFDNERSGYEPDPQLYRRSADYFVWNSEAG